MCLCDVRQTVVENGTHWYVWHDSLICVTWLIHMCDMTHWYVWRDTLKCMTWLIHLCVTRDRQTMGKVLTWHDIHSYLWSIHICEEFIFVKHSYLWYIHICGTFMSCQVIFFSPMWYIWEMIQWYDTDEWSYYSSYVCTHITHVSQCVAVCCSVLQCVKVSYVCIHATHSYVSHPCNTTLTYHITHNQTRLKKHKWVMLHKYEWFANMNEDQFIFVQHDPCACVAWLMCICDMTHTYVWHDAFVCVTCGRRTSVCPDRRQKTSEDVSDR